MNNTHTKLKYHYMTPAVSIERGGHRAELKTLPASAVPVILSIILGAHFFLPDDFLRYHIFEPPFLMPVLNNIFLGLSSFCVCLLAARGYYRIGSLNLALLGSGALAFGLAGASAGWFIRLEQGVNTTVTIFNCGALLSGILHFSSAIADILELPPETDIGRRKRTLAISYAGVFLTVTLIVTATLADWTPVFYIQQVGPSLIRQFVLGSATVLLCFSGIYILTLYFKSRNDFFFWYALGLMLIAEGLLGVFFTRTFGGIIGWTGRCAQYLGGIYLLVAVFRMLAERSIEEVLSELNRSPRKPYESIFENSLDGIILGVQDGPILTANPAACGMLGDDIANLRESTIGNLLDSDSFDVAKFREDLAALAKASAELNMIRRDGSRLPVNVSCAVFRDTRGQRLEILTFIDISKRLKAEEALRREMAISGELNRELEQRVRERTNEIEMQYRELEELNSTIRQLAGKTIDAMESDRKTLSKEIHDSIAGTLAAIKMELEAHLSSPEQEIPTPQMPLPKIVAHLAAVIRETRSISNQLRSRTLDDFGLKPALTEYIQDFKRSNPGIVIISAIDIEGEDLATDIQTVIYRVMQEALNNVGKHSDATTVRIKLNNRQNQIRLEVADNGNSFDLSKVLSENGSPGGYGIHSMRERVEICKGEFRIRSEPGKGTVVSASIPT